MVFFNRMNKKRRIKNTQLLELRGIKRIKREKRTFERGKEYKGQDGGFIMARMKMGKCISMGTMHFEALGGRVAGGKRGDSAWPVRQRPETIFQKVNSGCVVENVLMGCGGTFVRNLENKKKVYAWRRFEDVNDKDDDV
ncbi:hypothetical protein Tco_0574374 [Tanacetum coccineum]